MLADIGQLVDTDHPAGVVLGASADAGDECVAAGQPLEDGARLLGDGGVLRVVDDRRERAVDVEQQAGRVGLLGEARD